MIQSVACGIVFKQYLIHPLCVCVCACVYQMRTNRAGHVLFPWFRMSCQLKSRETGVEWCWLKHGMPDGTNCLQEMCRGQPVAQDRVCACVLDQDIVKLSLWSVVLSSEVNLLRHHDAHGGLNWISHDTMTLVRRRIRRLDLTCALWATTIFCVYFSCRKQRCQKLRLRTTLTLFLGCWWSWQEETPFIIHNGEIVSVASSRTIQWQSSALGMAETNRMWRSNP